MMIPILIFIGAINNVHALDEKLLCTKSFCEDYIQENGCVGIDLACRAQNETYNGRLFSSPTVCNCCKICIANLKEGEFCAIGNPGNPLPTKMCGPGLYCIAKDGDHARCQPMNTFSKCYYDQSVFDNDRDNGVIGNVAPRPKCNGDGKYEPTVCVPGETCFCVNEDGERIFGEDIDLDNVNLQMKCSCSRMAYSARQLIESKYPALIARCDFKGSYDTLQCMEGQCFCVDAEGNLASERMSISTGISSLPCYNRTTHRHIVSMDSYLRSCEKLLLKKISEYSEMLVDGYVLMDAKLPNCQLDGWFAAVQETETDIYCSDPKGNVIEDFLLAKTDPRSYLMNCKCARSRYLLSVNEALEIPHCDELGNFEVFACRRGTCFCLNDNGLQASFEVAKYNICELPCCTDNIKCNC